MKLPKFHAVTQHFDPSAIKDVAGAVRDEFTRFDFGDKIQPGQSVAVGVASRGTHDLKALVTTTIGCLKALGLRPFVFPAMGSHGGGTAQGQAKVLSELGITEKEVGAPVVSNMDVVSLGKIESGAEVFFAKDALDADHVVVINRIKPHTAFRSDVESGLCKIMAVGCGRQKGAESMHRHDLATAIVPAAERIIQKAPILCGIAVTENALGGTHSMTLARPEAFPDVDRQWLKAAWNLLPRLPIDNLDILLVDEMGKNISGTGMDPNVIGFWRRAGGPREPDYNTLIVLGLTSHSQGNGTGIGFADLTTQQVISRIDWQATYLNSMTSGFFNTARMPMPLENDRRAIETALNRIPEMKKLRMARIINTAELEQFWVTEAVLPELGEKQNIDIDHKSVALQFDKNNRILPFDF